MYWRHKTTEVIVIRVSPKYQIVVPRAVREAKQLRPDAPLLFSVSGDSAILRNRSAGFVEAMRRLHKEIWPPDPAESLEGERAMLLCYTTGGRGAA